MLAFHVRLGLSVGLDHPYALLADGAAGHHGCILKETIIVVNNGREPKFKTCSKTVG